MVKVWITVRRKLGQRQIGLTSHSVADTVALMNSSTPYDSKYSWFRLAITVLIATVGNVGMWAIIVIIPAVQAEFEVSRSDAALPYTLTMVGYALGNYFIGRAVDKYGITKSLIVCALGIAAGFVVAAASGSLISLSIVQFFIGFGAAACFGPVIADVSHWFLKRRGVAVGIAACGNYLSGAIWPLLLTDIIAENGWRTAYMVLAAVSVVVMIPLALLLKRQVEHSDEPAATASSNFGVQTARFTPRELQMLLCIAGMGCCIAMAMPQVHIVSICTDLGFGPAVGAEMLSLMLLGGVGSRLASGFIADKLGGIKTLLIGGVLQCLALFLYLPFDGLVSLYVVSLVFGLSQGGIVPSYAVIVREYLPAREAGARVGFVMMATIFGMAVGGWMAGVIYDVTGSYEMAFYNGIAWNFLNIGIMLLILYKSGRSKDRTVMA